MTDEDRYRGQWKLGRIVKIIGSTDHVRRVQLKIGDGTLLEIPIHKLILILENDDQS